MKRLMAAMLAVCGLWSVGCAERIDPGYVGIKVNYYGDDKGPENYPLVSGMQWYNPLSTSVLEYPTFAQTASWTKGDEDGEGNEETCFNSKEGMTICVDLSLTYSLDRTRVPAFYVKFRSDDLKTFTHGFMRNTARDAFNEVGAIYGVEDIYGPKKEELLKVVRERINATTKIYGVQLDQFGVVGTMRLPQNVVQALNSKIQATQDALRVENELRQTQAEAQKQVAQAEGAAKSAIAKAQGEAQANRLLQESISDRLIQWRELEIKQAATQKWNGALPMYSGGQQPMPFIQVK